MKRWQDRGEVEDSEDDELSLGRPSPSPEQPRKRLKHDRQSNDLKNEAPGGTAAPKSHATVDVDFGPKSLEQRKVAITYGHTAKETISESPTITTNESNLRSLNSRINILDASSEEPLFKAKSPASDVSSTTDSDLDELPDIKDLWSRAHIPAAQQSTPDLLCSPTRSHGSPSTTPTSATKVPSTAAESQAEEPVGGGAKLQLNKNEEDSPSTSTTIVRRSLRARKPNQINPYQYERAEYLHLCKKNGVKPIRLAEQASNDEESQEKSHESSTQDLNETFLSSSQSNPEVLESTTTTYHIEQAGHENRSDGRLPKRRRLDRPVSHDLATLSSSATSQTRMVELTGPLSQPCTDSERSCPDEGPSIFKMPPGFTPMALQMPQHSSQVEHVEARNNRESDSSPRGSRRSIIGHSRKTSSISISSASEQESEIEAKRFRREQKRIKGVLPASWLKIDFRAQKSLQAPESAERRKYVSPLPRKVEPQKGIARKLMRKRVSSEERDEPGLPSFSGNLSDTDVSTRSTSPNRQQHFEFGADGGRFNLFDMRDDEVVENDFIDPMLAAPSRPRRSEISRHRQPRITQAFQRFATSAHRFTEERLRSNVQSTHNEQHAPRVRRVQKRPRAERLYPVNLNILDVLDTSPSKDIPLPQFIKLAARRTRHGPNCVRQFPTQKVLRLATAEDTAEASSTLRAWQEGTIAPRPDRKRPREHGRTNSPRRAPIVRTALDEISSNQRRIPINHVHADARSGKTRLPKRIAQPEMRQQLLRNHARTTAELNLDMYSYDGLTSATVQASRRRMEPPGFAVGPRDAQLESLEDAFDQNYRSAMFERRMQCLTENISRRKRQPREGALQLDRFLEDGKNGARALHAESGATYVAPSTVIMKGLDTTPILSHGIRKRAARRLDAHSSRYIQRSDTPSDDFLLPDENDAHETPKPVLQELGSFGAQYSTNFDMRPLEIGTFFHQSTFIGSGDLHEALTLSEHDLDAPRGCMRVHFGDEVLDWSIWRDEVAVHLVRISNTIFAHLDHVRSASGDDCKATTDVVVYLLRSIVRYFAKCLAFADSVDRLACIDSSLHIVTSLSQATAGYAGASASASATKLAVHILQYAVVLSREAMQLSEHSSIPPLRRTHAKTAMLQSVERLVNLSIKGATNELGNCYERNRVAHVRESGFKDEASVLASLVIVSNVLRSAGLASSFWDIMQGETMTKIGTTCSVKYLERMWYDMFTFLPALELDDYGVACAGARIDNAFSYWPGVQVLLNRVFELYEASSAVRCSTVNGYVRALLSRCFCLANQWGWLHCELALSTIYDFFAHRNLHLLNSEESRGSPQFLEDVHSILSLEPKADDRSFHIFLKLLLMSYRNMREQGCPARKFQSITSRLTPNHSRSYRKDAMLKKVDLEALRNHYDLLTTLYCAAPPDSRPRIYLLQNLVDYASSHREACRLSVRAWTYVAVFQASTDEPVDALHPLTEWYAEMIKATLTQLRVARSEAERDFEVAQSEAHHAGTMMSSAVLEDTIENNQAQIAATIVDALAGLKRALQSSTRLENVRVLVAGSEFLSVLALFEPRQRRLREMTIEALCVVNAALDARSSLKDQEGSHLHGSSDSQEFGDYSALQAFAEEEEFNTDHLTLLEYLLDRIFRFLSNVFGADAAADDSILQTTIDTWLRLARGIVDARQKEWTSFVDSYSPIGWHQMRDTGHKRKFSPYFMSRLVQESQGSEHIKQAAILTWVVSLSEREAVLKFQHVLTSTLINYWPNDPLLTNLPFTADGTSGEYRITLFDLRQRRIALVSSVLQNMREHLASIKHDPQDHLRFRSSYSSILRHLMNAMKARYQELQPSIAENVADAVPEGAYVNFVHEVVSLLQQYAGEIHPVDRFFVDSKEFPLPAADPTYVVGRLRSYIPKLWEFQPRKQLIVFIQTVIERAMIDGQQPSLIDQISTAMIEPRMIGRSITSCLWLVVCRTIVPAYIMNIFETDCSWIAAVPLLRACEKVLPALLYSWNFEEQTTDGTVNSVGCIFSSISQQLDVVLARPDQLGLAGVSMAVSAMLRVGRESITLVASTVRAGSASAALSEQLDIIYTQAIRLKRYLQGKPDLDLIRGAMPFETSDDWQPTIACAKKQLDDTVNKCWYHYDGRYFVRREYKSQELVVELDDSTQERGNLIEVMTSFCRRYNATLDIRSRRRQAQRACDSILGDVVI